MDTRELVTCCEQYVVCGRSCMTLPLVQCQRLHPAQALRPGRAPTCLVLRPRLHALGASTRQRTCGRSGPRRPRGAPPPAAPSRRPPRTPAPAAVAVPRRRGRRAPPSATGALAAGPLRGGCARRLRRGPRVAARTAAAAPRQGVRSGCVQTGAQLRRDGRRGACQRTGSVRVHRRQRAAARQRLRGEAALSVDGGLRRSGNRSGTRAQPLCPLGGRCCR